MPAIAQPRSAASLPLPRATHRNGLHTAVVATAATFVGALLISALMAASVLLTGPLPVYDGGPSSQPVPQPTATSGLDL
ncbi:MAG TPA: hypothetical protein VFH90_11270 [Candidatus Limnocylindria bacterium]|nr:hypothetical protein [Candidatus Limnocylindria bacterium]